MITNEQFASVDWQRPPLGWLAAEQQLRIKDKAEVRRLGLGEVVWSTDTTGSEFLIVSGNVRLVPDQGKSIVLKAGDWFGDLPELSGQWKARTASKEVVVLAWPASVWAELLKDSPMAGEMRSPTRRGRSPANWTVVAAPLLCRRCAKVALPRRSTTAICPSSGTPPSPGASKCSGRIPRVR